MAKQKTIEMAVERKLDTVERYEFEPIKGYPMLHWKGKRPFRGTQYFPAQLKENHGEPVKGWMNRIYWGDNLQVMSHLLKEFRGKVDLVYIDPPFDSNADYKIKIGIRGKSVSNDHIAFEEKQYGDIWVNDTYLQFMYERFIVLRELLSDSGSLFLHCDWHKSHYLRCVLDEVFGTDSLVNEIVWKRTSARSDSNQYNHIHDTIFFVKKGSEFTFNAQYEKHTDEYINKYYTYTEANGRRYATIDATQSGLRTGESGNPWRGFDPSLKGNHWKFKTSKLDELDKEGRIYWPTKEGGWPRLKSYLDEVKGSAIQSIWSEIKAVNSQADERSDYPTQKPEALLDRLIRGSSNPGDLVLDCFMGSGTTQAVSMKLGRRFIGADINLGSIQTTTKRLLGVAKEISKKAPELEFSSEDGESKKVDTFYTGFSVHNVNQYDIFRNEVEAKELLLQALEIQPLPGNSLYDGEKDGRMVKVMPVNRIATRADLSTLVANFDYKEFAKREAKNPNKPVENLLIICMGHEPDLKAMLEKEVPHKLDVEIVDILRDKQDLQFKREAEAKVVKSKKGELVIEQFYPMNLLQKLSVQKETVEDWRELVESVMVDWNYDGGVFEPKLVDVPDKDELVKGTYPIPKDAGTIMVKITDLLSESLEIELR
ncbi:MAG: site-specific DNA-methyltransferase [Flavobacteriales bacterium]|nr:site-specific DNA-methyltransferase [Flavobacteriales bacterium]